MILNVLNCSSIESNILAFNMSFLFRNYPVHDILKTNKMQWLYCQYLFFKFTFYSFSTRKWDKYMFVFIVKCILFYAEISDKIVS